ncbi:Profilin [Dissostichus eleginoides]|uniref:Profilin n=1 Tax=Dissostichus eleginoides TaxID=100907 RepID=A0AAD9BW59_DISEL|nr:Profilin [Dissostichus eleginoides]
MEFHLLGGNVCLLTDLEVLKDSVSVLHAEQLGLKVTLWSHRSDCPPPFHEEVKGSACARQLCDLLPVVPAFKQIALTDE